MILTIALISRGGFGLGLGGCMCSQSALTCYCNTSNICMRYRVLGINHNFNNIMTHILVITEVFSKIN